MNWKTTFASLAEEWCAEFSYSKPQEALRHMRPITRHGTKGVLVFPSEFDGKLSPRQLYECHAELEKNFPTLALVLDAKQLQDAPAMGNRILCCPDYPEVALAAIRSASWVISFDPFVAQIAKELGVVCFTPGSSQSGAQALGWDTNGIAASVQGWVHRLKQVPAGNFLAAQPAGAPEFGICAVADSKYIGFFFGLVENLLQVSQVPWKIHLLALDEKAKELALKQYPQLPISVSLASEVWPEKAWQMYQSKPIAERAYASKPHAVLEALKTFKGAPLYFCDVDLHFAESPATLNKEFGKHQLLFMPQWSDVFAWARFHGMFNAGFIGVLPGGERFIKWWEEMCLHFCRVEMEKGYFTDQVFLDMGLWHFPEIGVYRAMDQNVAPWNRKTLGVYRPGRASGELRLKDNRVVKSFHAAGPDTEGFFQLKFAWDQVVSFFSVLQEPDELRPLFSNTLDQQLVNQPELQQAIQVRAQWSRRLRRPAAEQSPSYIRNVLSPAGKSFSAFLQRVEKIWESVRSVIGHLPPPDSVSREEQRILVDIQQRFAFASLSNPRSFNSSSRVQK